MAMNYADKFEKKVAESFKINSMTQNAINHDYDFMGVDTIKVYSVDTVAMGDYRLTGDKRYGNAEELGNTTKSYQLKTDRAFTFTIDRRNNQDTMGVMEVGSALKRQVEQRVIPEIDKYRLKVITEGAKALGEKGGTKAKHVAKISKANIKNAYANFLEGITTLLDEGTPMEGCFAYISTDFYKAIRLDDAFIKASDMAQEMRIKGVVGMVEGIPLVHVPSSYFTVAGNNLESGNANATVHFILMNKQAILGAEKLTDYKVHDNPPGINGWLVEGRLRYDAFVLENKENMLYLAINQGK